MVQRYDNVLVHEPGIVPWRGSVRAIKPPVPVDRKGKTLEQWADVLREDGIEMIVPVSYLEVLEVLEEYDAYADPFHGERNEGDVPLVSEQERAEAVGIGGALEVGEV